MKYMITGTLSKDRKTVKSFLESKDGTEGTKTTMNYLIVGEKPGSKLDYAIDNQITIIKEKHLVALLGPIEVKVPETEKELTKRIKKGMVEQVREIFEFEGFTAEEFVMPYFYDGIRGEFSLTYDEVPEEVGDFDEELQELFKKVENKLKEEMKKTGFKLLDELSGNVKEEPKKLSKFQAAFKELYDVKEYKGVKIERGEIRNDNDGGYSTPIFNQEQRDVGEETNENELLDCFQMDEKYEEVDGDIPYVYYSDEEVAMQQELIDLYGYGDYIKASKV